MRVVFRAVYASKRFYLESMLGLSPGLTNEQANEIFSYFVSRGIIREYPAGRVISYVLPKTGRRITYTTTEPRYYLRGARIFGEVMTYISRYYEIHLSGELEIFTKGKWKRLSPIKSPIFWEIVFYNFVHYNEEPDVEGLFKTAIKQLAERELNRIKDKGTWEDIRLIGEDWGVDKVIETDKYITDRSNDEYDFLIFMEGVTREKQRTILKGTGKFEHHTIY